MQLSSTLLPGSHTPALALSLALALALAGPSAAQAIEWVPVGDPGNPNHPTLPSPTNGEGSIPYRFDIGKVEVTNDQYAAFLNAVAKDDTNGVWYSLMSSSALGGIDRIGSAPDFSYMVKAGYGDKPVVYTSFWDATRFANWLHNGSPSGAQDDTTTEDGAYTLDPVAIAANTVTRNPGALYAVPSRPEFWKAGYYEDATQTWYVSPARSLVTMTGADPSLDDGNTGNINRPVFVLEDVGSYALSVGPHGTFDMGGNAYEWLERISGNRREVAGGAYATGAVASNINNGTTQQRAPSFRDGQSGLRLVRLTDAARVGFRTAGANPSSLVCALPVPATVWTVTADLTTTGHSLAAVVAFDTPFTLTLGGGQVLLAAGTLAFELPSQPGPLATWNVPVPTTLSLVGAAFHAQAIHYGGVAPFALSNAQDCTIGY